MPPSSSDGTGRYRIPPRDPSRPLPKQPTPEPENIRRRPVELPPMVNIKAGEEPPAWNGPGSDRTGVLRSRLGEHSDNGSSEGAGAARTAEPGDGEVPEPSAGALAGFDNPNGSSESVTGHTAADEHGGNAPGQGADRDALAGSDDEDGLEKLQRAVREART